jgi:hypothetical protein
MVVSCDKCFFSKNGMCRVNPPDPLLVTEKFPEIAKDKYPCGEYVDRETGDSIETLLKLSGRKKQYASLHPQKQP